VGEALLLAHRAGIDLEVLRSALGRSAAASEFVRRDLGALLGGDCLESLCDARSHVVSELHDWRINPNVMLSE